MDQIGLRLGVLGLILSVGAAVGQEAASGPRPDRDPTDIQETQVTILLDRERQRQPIAQADLVVEP